MYVSEVVIGLIIFAAIAFINHVGNVGWFLATSRWARKMDERLSLMFCDLELHGASAVSEAFRQDCISFLEDVLRYAEKKDKPYKKSYYESERGFYCMVATRAYRKLLLSPLQLYTGVHWSAKHCYRILYQYALKKLIALGVHDESVLSQAEVALEKVEQFCESERRAGTFVDW